MPHRLSHRKTLPHAEFQIVVSGISEASKCFLTIELLDEIMPDLSHVFYQFF